MFSSNIVDDVDFYMTRRGEKREKVEVHGQMADMKFFIYDFDL